MITVAGVLFSIVTAYIAKSFNNINDFLQLVFSFVNGPLFATFLLGMFWKRTTGHGAFCGLLAGTLAAVLTHGLTLAEGKGGWIAPLYEIRSGMGQAFIVAAVSWIGDRDRQRVALRYDERRRGHEVRRMHDEAPARHEEGWLGAVEQRQDHGAAGGDRGLLLLLITILLNIIFF